ncbi:MAG: [FeFe] hydrogenase, group A [Elusimicrobiota bacterium]|nr:[FeFe] hydrogenase, group A [Elusimicrobiota bacterium]
MSIKKSLTVNSIEVIFENEKNILEVIRKAGIQMPTLCYNTELSIYGSCRMCIVECEGMGIIASCSTPPQNGMKIKTHTDEIRAIRKTILELLLANHSQNCFTCSKSMKCDLQKLAMEYNIDKINFKRRSIEEPKLGMKDPNKCILCGQCVRVCEELEGIGAVNFSYRGSNTKVIAAFDKPLKTMECVSCGQCIQVCPTGALTVIFDTERVSKYLNDKNYFTIAQIAPSVRVAIGEEFGFEPGELTTKKMVTALRMLGFDKVFDTTYGADLTIMEEATEFLERVENKGIFPMFTSCCPARVNFIETFYPDMLDHLSSCKSPQQMFGAVTKAYSNEMLGVEKDKLKIISIMPCTAKRGEAMKDKFKVDGISDIDFVLTTQEIARMIHEKGIDFKNLPETEFDSPFKEVSGAGVIFGNTGGVMEAALRFVKDFDDIPPKPDDFRFQEVRDNHGIKEATIRFRGNDVNVAIVAGLANARYILEEIKTGKSKYHFIEIMTCPRGCISGGGQPISLERDFKEKRIKGLYNADENLVFHKCQDNPDIKKIYKDFLEKPGSYEAHHKLHTYYQKSSLKNKYQD